MNCEEESIKEAIETMIEIRRRAIKKMYKYKICSLLKYSKLKSIAEEINLLKQALKNGE